MRPVLSLGDNASQSATNAQFWHHRHTQHRASSSIPLTTPEPTASPASLSVGIKVCPPLSVFVLSSCPQCRESPRRRVAGLHYVEIIHTASSNHRAALAFTPLFILAPIKLRGRGGWPPLSLLSAPGALRRAWSPAFPYFQPLGAAEGAGPAPCLFPYRFHRRPKTRAGVTGMSMMPDILTARNAFGVPRPHSPQRRRTRWPPPAAAFTAQGVYVCRGAGTDNGPPYRTARSLAVGIA